MTITDPTRVTLWARRPEATAALEHFLESDRVKSLLKSAPSPEALHEILETVYWVSLQRDEGRPRLISVVYSSPRDGHKAMPLETPVRFDEHELRRVAAATMGPGSSFLHRPGIRPPSTLGVHHTSDGLFVWGLVQDIAGGLQIRAIAPGRLTVQVDKEHALIVDGAHAHSLVYETANEPHGLWPPNAMFLFAGAIGSMFPHENERIMCASLLLQVIDAMRMQGNGGTLLVVPEKDDGWRQFIRSDWSKLDFGGLRDERDRLMVEASDGQAPKDLHNFFVGDRQRVSASLASV